MILGYDDISTKIGHNIELIIKGDADRVEYNYAPIYLVNKVMDRIDILGENNIIKLIFVNGIKAEIIKTAAVGTNELKETIELSKNELYTMYFESNDREEEIYKYVNKHTMSDKLSQRVKEIEEEIKEIKYKLDNI